MFQHTAQCAFLNRWKTGRFLYRIDKSARRARHFQSANYLHGFGANDWQSPDMEKAFAGIERVIGYTDHDGELKNPNDRRTLARWLALHFVRSRRFRDHALANGRDYTPAINLVEESFVRSYSFFANFSESVFITGDICLAGFERFYRCRDLH